MPIKAKRLIPTQRGLLVAVRRLQLQPIGHGNLALDANASRTLQVYVDQTQKRRRLLKLDP